jgi:hypothetical protein
MMEKSGSREVWEVGFADALLDCCVTFRNMLNCIDDMADAAGAGLEGRTVTVVSMYLVLVLVTSIVEGGSLLEPTVTVTRSTSVVVTVRLEQVAASGVACCLLAIGVTVSVSVSYIVLVTVWRSTGQEDLASAKLARGRRAKMEDFMAGNVYSCERPKIYE